MPAPTPAEYNDLVRFFERIREIAAHRKLAFVVLGEVFGDPIPLLTPIAESEENKPHILIATAFHGNEKAGPWGLLHFFETAEDKLFEDAHLSFLPLVNPWGFRNDTRWNRWGQDPNDGYCAPVGRGLSAEGEILASHYSRLRRLGRDGFLALHGDPEEHNYYVYTYGYEDKPGEFAFLLRDEGAKFFSLADGGNMYGDPMDSSIIYCIHDGSIEDKFFRDKVPFVAVPEMPGEEPLHKRIVANAQITSRFVEYVADAVINKKKQP